MEVIKDPREAQKLSDTLRANGKKIGFVATMGALHKAHASLIDRARAETDFVIVSIFINPAQFGPDEDFTTYPRRIEEDKKLCSEHGTDLVFIPETTDIYKKDHKTVVHVKDLTDTMCGASRPAHFEGVVTIVSKLFNIIKPHKAYFGQKDFQQLKIIARMNDDLDFNIDIIMCDIIREEDGLAVSSRNKYLDDIQRRQATVIYKTLKKGERLINNKVVSAEKVIIEMTNTIKKNIPDAKIDYIGIYDASSLKPVKTITGEIVIATAVNIGKARLIDNILLRSC